MPVRPVMVRLIPLLAIPLCAICIAVPAAGAADLRVSPPGAALLTRSAVGHPALASAALAGFAEIGGGTATSTYDSTGQTVGMETELTGQFVAEFGGLASLAGPAGTPNGNVQVTPVDSEVTCTITHVFAVISNLSVEVFCFNYNGTPAASAVFTVEVTRPKSVPNGVLDFAWVAKDNSTYALKGSDQYNSSRKTNSVSHLGTGRYLVTMPGPRSASTGTVKVTPVGTTAGDCDLARWAASRRGQQFSVDCYSAAGTPQNREFSIVYASRNNLMGQNGQNDANAFASRTALSYQPSPQYDSRRGAAVTVVRLATGFYYVFFSGSPSSGNKNGGEGDVQLTPVSGSDRHCLVFWSDQPASPFTQVFCFNNVGAPVNTNFTVQWVASP